MDRFSRNWYQNFANFSEMATSWSFLVLHPHSRTHPRNHTFIDHAITHLWTDFLEIGIKILQIFQELLLCGFFKFYSPTHALTHAITHLLTNFLEIGIKILQIF